MCEAIQKWLLPSSLLLLYYTYHRCHHHIHQTELTVLLVSCARRHILSLRGSRNIWLHKMIIITILLCVFGKVDEMSYYNNYIYIHRFRLFDYYLLMWIYFIITYLHYLSLPIVYDYVCRIHMCSWNSTKKKQIVITRTMCAARLHLHCLNSRIDWWILLLGTFSDARINDQIINKIN